MSAALKTDARPAAAETLDPDVLAAVIDETARRVEARAARPSPIHLHSWQEIERFAEKAANSGMVPKDYMGKPDAICIAVQMGSELGLAPMQSLQNIAVINGRPAVWGDAMLGLCRAASVSGYIKEWSEGEGENQICYCEAKRRDDPTPIRKSFSVADARRANLWKDEPKTKKKGRDGSTYEADSGPWYSYPQRMLQMRARGFCLRDAFPDVLKGLLSAEEARDIPWEDTGLSIGVPPIGTDKPISTSPSRRDEVNAPVVRAPSPTNGGGRHSIAPQPGAPDPEWRACLDKVGPALLRLRTLALVEATAAGPTCGDIMQHGPEWAKAELARMLADNVARFRTIENAPEHAASDATSDSTTTSPEELAEVRIEGEAKMAAGD